MNRYVFPQPELTMSQLISAIEEFDGACDPDFDNDFQELDRQFAERRFAHANDLN